MRRGVPAPYPRQLFLHHAEWVLSHPRFGLLMVLLVGLSLTEIRWLAAALFLVFLAELGLRVAIHLQKRRTNPYRTALSRKLDLFFLLTDTLATASLLTTVAGIEMDAEPVVLARLARALWLLRTLRLFRFIDFQALMYSPTYGMFASALVLMSFFATGTMLWIILLFFSVELVVRALVLRRMRFDRVSSRRIEWAYWWLDLGATMVMVPDLAVIPYGSALRILRLIRLLRPWVVILRNLREVVREGQFVQEINLIVLLLGVLSVCFGALGFFAIPQFDFTQDGQLDAEDHSLYATVWFAFRMFIDPGNVVTYPSTPMLAAFTVVSVVLGVFLFAFFIGIGASIVSGLMRRLRNEQLSIANHMAMLGWNRTSPFVLDRLRKLAERSGLRLRLVLLNDKPEMPDELAGQRWLAYRWGRLSDMDSLRRISLDHARQAIINLPSDASEAEALATSLFQLLLVRRINPDIYLSVTTPGLASPKLASQQHPLQIGWDNTGYYERPTVVHSAAEVRANLLKNIVLYPDFDQVLERLMVPDRADESALQVCEWNGNLIRGEDGTAWLTVQDAPYRAALDALAAQLMLRGVVLVACADRHGRLHPLHRLPSATSVPLRAILGIAISAHALHAELMHALRHPEAPASAGPEARLAPVPRPDRLRILLIGQTGSLGLLLKSLLRDLEHVELTILDRLDEPALVSLRGYLERRLDEMPGARARVRIEAYEWDFSDMAALRAQAARADRILLGKPSGFSADDPAMITVVLSHLVTIFREENLSPETFPILESREQARLLQKELERFEHGFEIHVTVPEEFFGIYVAHTSFQMYACESADSYELLRPLRHCLDDLMGDVGERDGMELGVLEPVGPLPDDPAEVHRTLMRRGYIWIGYRLRRAFPGYSVETPLFRLFPRADDFRCRRQFQILLNPFANPVTARSWTEHRDEIAELIVIGEDFSGQRENPAAPGHSGS